MRQIHLEAKRPRGRPQIRSDEETRHLVVEAAAKEFHANGFSATSMGTVAQKAGISTKTIYRLIPTKAELFTSVVEDRIGRFMLAIDNDVLDTLELTQALEHILIAYGRLTLDDETIALNRLVIGEYDRFPEISGAFYKTAIVQTTTAIVTWLKRQSARGLIRLDDPTIAAGMLRGMMIMEIQRAAMLGQRAAPDDEELVERAKACARLFLDGCRA